MTPAVRETRLSPSPPSPLRPASRKKRKKPPRLPLPPRPRAAGCGRSSGNRPEDAAPVLRRRSGTAAAGKDAKAAAAPGCQGRGTGSQGRQGRQGRRQEEVTRLFPSAAFGRLGGGCQCSFLSGSAIPGPRYAGQPAQYRLHGGGRDRPPPWLRRLAQALPGPRRRKARSAAKRIVGPEAA